MRKLIALLLALVMVLGMVACGAKEEAAPEAAPEVATEAAPEVKPEATPEAEEEKEPVTLTMWYLTAEGVDQIYQDYADDVHEAYPWITIVPEPQTSDGIMEKMSVAMATGTTPDIYMDNYSRCAAAVEAGLCVDLTDVLADNQDIFVAEETCGIVDGKNYYIGTYAGGAYAMGANMTLIEELGLTDMLPEDHETWTYDEFLNVCRAAKAADPEVTPVVLYAGSRSGDAWYYSWFLGNGANILNDEHTAMAINEGANKEAALEALNVFKTLIDEGLVASGAASLIDADANTMFDAGKVLFQNSGAGYIPALYDRAAEGLAVEMVADYYAIPSSTGTKPPRSVSWGGSGYVGFSNNGHDEEIKLAIDFLLKNSEYRERECYTRGNTPATNDITVVFDNEQLTEVKTRAASFDARWSDCNFGILEPWWTDFRDTFYVQLQDFFVGNIDAETLLNNWVENGNTVISSAIGN